MRARRLALALALVVGAACSTSVPVHLPTVTQAPTFPSPSPRVLLPAAVYAALGASETAGIGTQDAITDSFPQQLFEMLGQGSVLYNFGIPSEATAAAIKDELPQAEAVHPTLATVWFNVDDLIGSVPVDTYEANLDTIVGGLRRAGVARVLVANTPQLDHLPAYAACRPNPPPGSEKCPLGSITLPPPDQVDAETVAYNAAVTRVVAKWGARLVDLYASGDVPDLHPNYVSQDGFHPSTEGAAAIAAAFAAADR